MPLKDSINVQNVDRDAYSDDAQVNYIQSGQKNSANTTIIAQNTLALKKSYSPSKKTFKIQGPIL
jgi:hypothetical protein